MYAMTTTTLTLKRLVLLDAALLAAACLLPVFAHLTALPLYQFNPMLLLLLCGMALGADRRNAMLLAVLLPAVSMLATGMPAPAKALCMMAEYGVVAAVCGWLSQRSRLGDFGAVLLAMAAGKACFYALKAALLAPAVLVGTSVWLQLAVMLAGAALFAALKSRAR